MKEKSVIGWRKLDNAAKLFPAIANEKANHVFRISATLQEAIDPKCLKRALEEILPEFDTFRVKLRRGIFWFYFEENDQKPQIEKECFYPCQFLDSHQKQNFLFRVSYFQNRINLEVFHVLTDGLGAVRFLEELLYGYLNLQNKGRGLKKQRSKKEFLTEDSYIKNYKRTKKQAYRTTKAFQIKGRRKKFDVIDVLHGYVKLTELKRVSQSYGVSITKYLAAVLIFSIYKTAGKGKKNLHPIVLNLPVNLREFYDSKTTSNFFAVMMIEFQPNGKNDSLKQIVDLVSRQMDEKLSKKNMEKILSYNVAAEKNPVVRILPLFIKNIGLRLMFWRSKKSVTATLSNLGKMEILPEYRRKIKRFQAMMGVFPGQEFKCTVISYGQETAVTFTSVFEKSQVQDRFFKLLESDGVEVMTEDNQTKPEDGGIYPDAEPRKKYLKRLRTVISFLSAAAIGVLFGINYLTYQGFWWAVIASAGILYLVLFMSYPLIHRGNPAAKVVVGALETNGLMSVIDLASGGLGWSFAYADPGMMILANGILLVFILMNRKNWHSYVVYQVLLTICNFGMHIFCLLGWVSNPLVLWISCGISIGMTGILMISGHRKGIKELKRRFYA